MKNLNIAMVSEHASPLATLGGADAGGQNVHVAALSNQLASVGCSVVVHTRRDDPSLPRRTEMSPGVVVDHVDAGPPAPVSKDDMFPYMAEFSRQLAEAWARDRPDIVHAHFWMSAVASLQAARPAGIPVAVTFHALGTEKRRYQGAADTSPAERLATEAEVAQSADCIIATSRRELTELTVMGASPERVTIVPCGVDLSIFNTAGRPFEVPHRRAPGPQDGAGKEKGRHLALVVGRLVERKGVQDAISSLKHLPDVDLVIAGGPGADQMAQDPEVRRLQARAVDEGVAERCHFMGRVAHTDVAALMRSAEVVICTPWYEPFGIVAVEAMACGVPVVATGVGGQLDTVIDGGTGIVVPAKDPVSIAQAVRHILDDPALAKRLGRAGAGRARSMYSWAQVGAATYDIYASLYREPALATRGPVTRGAGW